MYIRAWVSGAPGVSGLGELSPWGTEAGKGKDHGQAGCFVHGRRLCLAWAREAVSWRPPCFSSGEAEEQGWKEMLPGHSTVELVPTLDQEVALFSKVAADGDWLPWVVAT